MMHAENGPAIDVVAAQLVADGKTDPYYHGVARYPIFEGEATNRVIRLAEAAGVPVYIVHLSANDALDAVRGARDRGAQAFAETCPQYLFLSPRRPGQRLRGREVRVLAAAAREGPPLGGALDAAREGRPPGRLDRPLPVRLPRARRSSAGATSARSPTACRASRTASTCSTTAASSAAGSRASAGSRSSRPARPSCSGCTRARARSPSAPTPTSSSTTRAGSARSRAKTHHMDVDYSCYEGRSVQGASDVVLSRGSVVVRDGAFTGTQGRTAGSSSARPPTTPGSPDPATEDPMFVTLVHFHVKPDQVDTFLDATRANHEASIREDGNLRFDVLRAGRGPEPVPALRVVRRRGVRPAAHRTRPTTPPGARRRPTCSPSRATASATRACTRRRPRAMRASLRTAVRPHRDALLNGCAGSPGRPCSWRGPASAT